jgi:hypothetical protein
MARSKQSEQERTEFLEAIKADFDDRLARLAADPGEWVTFLETVAEFGAQYTLNNQFLLLMQAEKREMTPTFFLPFGNKAGTSGWKKYGRRVRAGETAFYVWAPVRRRPTEDEAARWEAVGRKVIRDEQGRPVVQVVGFHLSPTFDLSQTDGAPFEVPTVPAHGRPATQLEFGLPGHAVEACVRHAGVGGSLSGARRTGRARSCST